MVCLVGEDVERNPIEALQDEAVEEMGLVKWIAADERFFTIAAVLPPQDAGSSRVCKQQALGPELGKVSVVLPKADLAAGAKKDYPFRIFAGPKYRDELESVAAPTGGEAPNDAPWVVELDRAVNVNLAIISRPMLATLKAFHGWTGNWGLAIILLTLLVKLVTFYPAHKAMLSGKRMAKLAPKMAELRKKYGNDREKVGRETMNLYKTYGVNPVSGCLPMLIQMPVWIALFSTLSYSVELYRSAFFGYIVDLSRPDPYYILPLVMGAAMFFQMRMAPAAADPQQQKIMAFMMPIMFTFFQVFLPAGLALYMLTNYLFTMIHQIVVNRLDKKSGPLRPVTGQKKMA
jgi:YidC/Oxa1 family membrane protein insertase